MFLGFFLALWALSWAGFTDGHAILSSACSELHLTGPFLTGMCTARESCSVKLPQGTIISSLDLDYCVGNRNGRLVAQAYGLFFSNCTNCTLSEWSPTLSCSCADNETLTTDGNNTITSLNLNDVVSYDCGHLTCFNYVGVSPALSSAHRYESTLKSPDWLPVLPTRSWSTIVVAISTTSTSISVATYDLGTDTPTTKFTVGLPQTGHGRMTTTVFTLGLSTTIEPLSIRTIKVGNKMGPRQHSFDPYRFVPALSTSATIISEFTFTPSHLAPHSPTEIQGFSPASTIVRSSDYGTVPSTGHYYPTSLKPLPATLSSFTDIDLTSDGKSTTQTHHVYDPHIVVPSVRADDDADRVMLTVTQTVVIADQSTSTKAARGWHMQHHRLHAFRHV